MATVAGIALLISAVDITWFAPTDIRGSAVSTCLVAGEQVLAQQPGSAVNLEATEPGVSLAPARPAHAGVAK